MDQTKRTDDREAVKVPSTLGRIIRKVAPWLALVFIFWALLKLVPPREIMDEIKNLEWEQAAALFSLALLFITGVAIIDGTAMWYGFSRLEVKVNHRELVLVRLAMMLVASIATFFGQAGLAAYVVKKYKLGAGKAAGMVTYLFLVEVYGMVLAATIFLPILLLTGFDDPAQRGPLTVALVVITCSWPGLVVLVLGIRSEMGRRVVRRLKLDNILYPFEAIKTRDMIVLLLIKGVLALWQLGLTIPAFWIYGQSPPPLQVLAFMPLAILVSSIPITPARLGTTQSSWVFFFKYLIEPKVLFVFSLLLQFALNVARWVIGAAVLPFVYKGAFKKER